MPSPTLQYAGLLPRSGAFTLDYLVWVLVGANAASIALRGDHRALYDLLAGTAVVRRTADR